MTPASLLAAIGAVLACLAMTPSAAAKVALSNRDFASSTQGWTAPFAPRYGTADNSDAAKVVYAWDAKRGHSAPGSLSIEVPDDVKPNWYLMQTEITGARPNTVYLATAWVRSDNVRDGAGAYCSVEYFDGKGERIGFQNSSRLMGTQDWFRIALIFEPPKGTLRTTFDCLVHGHGKGWFDDVQVKQLAELPDRQLTAKPTVRILPDRIVNRGMIGIGAEQDPFFYTQENRDAGVTEEDIALCESRTREMDIDYARIFVQWHHWNPDADYVSRSWDTDFMKALYRELAFFKGMGVPVNLTNVDWGYDHARDPEKAASALGDLLERLVRTQGFTNIKYVTWQNEPNVAGNWTYAKLKQFVVSLHKELARRNLEKSVAMVEPDAVEDFSWLFAAAEDVDRYLGGYSAHLYMPTSMIASTTRAIRQAIDSAGPARKPLFVNEFGSGFQTEYSDALNTAETIIEALNSGADALSVWTLHEAVYPGNGIFRYGLWSFKDKQWAPKPVYHAYRLFTRYTDSGTKIVGAESTDPGFIKALATRTNGKWAVFVLNKARERRPVRISAKGLPSDLRMCTFSREAVAGLGGRRLDPTTQLKATKGAVTISLPGESLALITNW